MLKGRNKEKSRNCYGTRVPKLLPSALKPFSELITKIGQEPLFVTVNRLMSLLTN